MKDTALQSYGVAGGIKGDPPTNIDLRKPDDLNLVYRAVVNGWDVPQAVREQLCGKITDAIDFHSQQGNPRATSRAIKLCKMMILMEARNDVDSGARKSLHPLARKRGPELRRPRHVSARAARGDLDRVIERLSHTNPSLAESLRALLD